MCLMGSVCTGGLMIALWEIPVGKSVEQAMVADKIVSNRPGLLILSNSHDFFYNYFP